MVQEFDKAWLCDSFALHDINRCHGASLNSHRSQIERYSTKSDFNDNDPGLWTDAINGVRFGGPCEEIFYIGKDENKLLEVKGQTEVCSQYGFLWSSPSGISASV